MLIPGPGGMMYAAAPADGSGQGVQQQGAPQMSYGAHGMQGGMPAGAGYQVASAGGMQMAGGVAGQPQAADPMAYAKLAGYGQQGVICPSKRIECPSSVHHVHILTLEAAGACRGHKITSFVTSCGIYMNSVSALQV